MRDLWRDGLVGRNDDWGSYLTLAVVGPGMSFIDKTVDAWKDPGRRAELSPACHGPTRGSGFEVHGGRTDPRTVDELSSKVLFQSRVKE